MREAIDVGHQQYVLGLAATPASVTAATDGSNKRADPCAHEQNRGPTVCRP